MNKDRPDEYKEAQMPENALPSEKTEDVDDILGEINEKSGESGFHQMMHKYLGDDAAQEDVPDTGRIFRRHIDEELYSHVSASPDRAGKDKPQETASSDVRELYNADPFTYTPRPTFTSDGSVLYPSRGVGETGERVIFDADWESQAQEEAGKIEEIRRSGILTGETSHSRTFRFSGSDVPETPRAAVREDEASARDISLSDKPEKPEEIKRNTPVGHVWSLAESEGEILSEEDRQKAENAVLAAFSGDFDSDQALKARWADAVSQAQKRKEQRKMEIQKENNRLRSEEKLREKEKQVAEEERRSREHREFTGFTPVPVTEEPQVVPAEEQQPAFELPDDSELEERLDTGGTPENTVIKKTVLQKIAFFFKTHFSREGFRRFCKNNFPARGDSGREIFRKLVMDISFVALVAGLIYLAVYYHNYRARIRNYGEIGRIIEEDGNIPEYLLDEEWANIKAQYPDVEFPEGMNIKFAKIYAMNSDLVGNLKIEGLGVDTILLQNPDDNYYLYRDVFKKKSRYGSPYIKADSVMGKDSLSKNIIVYGHNTHDKLIFNKLENYMSPAGYLSAPIFTLDTLYETTKWKVFAVMLTNADPADDNGQIFDYLYSNFSSDQAFMEKIKGIQARSMIHTGVDVIESDHIITLYTCYRNRFDSGRLVIFARQLRDGESERIDTSKVYYDSSAYFPAAYYGKTETTVPAPEITEAQDLAPEDVTAEAETEMTEELTPAEETSAQEVDETEETNDPDDTVIEVPAPADDETAEAA